MTEAANIADAMEAAFLGRGVEIVRGAIRESMNERRGCLEPLNVDPECPDSAAWRIRVQDGLSDEEEMATLAHELGHWCSVRTGRDPLYTEAIADGSDSFTHLSRPARRAVIAEEVVAWRFGLRIALDHGLADAMAFLGYASRALENYRLRVDLGAEFDELIVDVGRPKALPAQP